MAKKSRSRLGSKKAGSTRNQKRKAAYAALAAEQQRSNSSGPGKHARAKARRAVKLVGTRVHRRPCGNHACKPCRLLAA